jgi:dehydrogenase/reductase SDR family protein 12
MSYLLRSSAFLAYGTSKFVKSGIPFPPFDSIDQLDLNGKSFMVTGANSGLGYATSRFFASRGGTVHMICRDKDRGDKALQEVQEVNANATVHLHICDVSEMDQIRGLVEKFRNDKIPLDVLVNNAGVMLANKEVTSTGLDKTFATNVLSNFLLTTLLIPVLSESKDPRVIFVSSGGGLTEDLNEKDTNFSQFQPWDGMRAYAITKRQQIALTEKFDSLYSNISFFCMHPGWVDTPQVAQAMPKFYNLYKNSLRSLEQGVDTICWLATSDKVNKKMSGLFFRDRQEEYKHLPLVGSPYSDKKRTYLWNVCCELTGM